MSVRSGGYRQARCVLVISLCFCRRQCRWRNINITAFMNSKNRHQYTVRTSCIYQHFLEIIFYKINNCGIGGGMLLSTNDKHSSSDELTDNA